VVADPAPGTEPRTPGAHRAGGSRLVAPGSGTLWRSTGRAVVVLGTPIVLANLLTWAVGFTDVFMVSRLGQDALAGLGMATQIFFLVVIFILAVTMGTMALVARAGGARDEPMVSHVFRQSVLLAGVLGVVIGGVGILVTPTLFRLLGATPEVAAAGGVYLRIVFLGVVAPVIDFTIASTMRGGGDAVTPLRITAGVVVLNVVGNYLLIFGPGPLPAFGIAGAAAATVLARSAGAWWGWRALRRGRGPLRVMPGSWRPDLELMRRVLRIGVPSAFEGFLRAGSSVVFVGIVARTADGAAAVAAHTVGLQLESFARMPAFAIAVAATSLVGQRLGAGDPPGAERAGWSSLAIGLALLSVLSALLFVLAPPVATLFADDPRTLELTVRYLRILALAQPLFLASVVLAGALRAGGDAAFPMWVSFFTGWVVLLPLAYLLAVTLQLGPAAAWFMMAVNYGVSALLTIHRFRTGRWRSMPV
jgi:putative MATE family efflux protein